MNAEMEKRAIKLLKMYEPPDGYYLGYSGGKDSEVILALAKMSGVKFHAVHNHTTVDAPETVYHIREKASGPENHLSISYPEKTMWQLIPEHKMPPTRLVRYCCDELKETGGQGELCVFGVRWAESRNRRENQSTLYISGKPKRTQKLADSLGVEYKVDKHNSLVLNADNDDSRRVVEQCYRTRRSILNPIIDWEDEDVWEYLHHYNVKCNPLYECGFNRIGCIGCPMASKARYMGFARYPKYKENYIKAFDRMLEARTEANLPQWLNGSSGEEVFAWWMQEDTKQITMLEDEK